MHLRLVNCHSFIIMSLYHYLILKTCIKDTQTIFGGGFGSIVCYLVVDWWRSIRPHICPHQLPFTDWCTLIILIDFLSVQCTDRQFLSSVEGRFDGWCVHDISITLCLILDLFCRDIDVFLLLDLKQKHIVFKLV